MTSQNTLIRAALVANMQQDYLSAYFMNEKWKEKISRIWKSFGSPRGLRKQIERIFNEIENKRAKRKLNRRFQGLNIHSQLSERWAGKGISLQRKVKFQYLAASRFAGNTYDRDTGDMRYVSDYDPKERAAVVRAEGWCQYTRRERHYIKKAGLVIRDPDTGQLVFIRISPEITTVAEALEFIKPASVRKAEAEGKQVIRQGDFYLIPQRTWNLKALRGTSHKVNENGTITISHSEHGELKLSVPHKAVQQIQVKNAAFESSRRGYSD